MVKSTKLYRQLLASSAQIISFRDFERLLRAFGFEHERTTGSHHHYVHTSVPWVLTVQPDGKDAKRYQVRRLLDIVAEYGLSIDE
ncbi:MAG TPA: type II toxin-antitoxin system HicA family toxin [Allosphingosinicella sp.]|nr:type II toxin-antitoxin system HicA family toxin [Allosphingosinicella sp.]